MPLPQDAIVQQSPSCLAANVQDELVLMSIEHGQYVALDSIGKDIWEHLAAPVPGGCAVPGDDRGL